MSTINPYLIINIDLDASINVSAPKYGLYQMFQFQHGLNGATTVDIVKSHRIFQLDYLSSDIPWYHLDEGNFYFRVFGEISREIVDATRVYVRGDFGMSWHDFLEKTLG